MPNEYDYEGRKVVLCYNPIDDIDHYSLVRYMKDEELDYINRRRKDAGYPVIKRLAHTKTGYVQCASQREKLNIEYEAEQGVDVKKLISDFEQIANKMVSSNWGRLK